MINSKEKIINYFKSGIKEAKNFKIGIEHEKFLFNNNDNRRIDYSKIKEMFAALLEFGWNPVFEKKNIRFWHFESAKSKEKTFNFHKNGPKGPTNFGCRKLKLLTLNYISLGPY